MNFGNKMMLARKDKQLSREDLGKNIGTSGAIIGRYERNDMKPSIEIATKIANALDISLDYLVGISSIATKNKKAVNRLETITNMPEQKQNELLNVIDAYIRDFKAKQAYAS